ncbi:MAG: glycosyltransferase [bacterium]
MKKIAIIHDWLVKMRGGEKVLESLCEIFKEAEIFTLIYDEKNISSLIKQKKINTSFLQNFLGIKKHYPFYLPLFPLAIEQFNLKKFDLIISSSHCVAKGIIPHSDTCHISYIYTPARYIWDFYFDHFENKNPFKKIFIPLIINYLRIWDVISSYRVDYFIACSEYIKMKIEKYYRKTSTVIYPPIDTSFFTPENVNENYYLIVSALTPYKKIDIAIKSFNKLNLPLIIIGNGSEQKKLKKMANKNIKFLNWQSNIEIKKYYAYAKALIFPMQEDFGISSLESQSCGRPVIAYKKGGSLETIIENKTGIFFEEQNEDSLIEAVLKFQKMKFDKQKIREHSLTFDKEIFNQKFKNFVKEKTNFNL